MRVSRRGSGVLSPLPTVEVCNGMDDDCDGEVDNLPPTVCGNGRCAHVVAACTDGQPRRLNRDLNAHSIPKSVMVVMMIAMALWMRHTDSHLRSRGVPAHCRQCIDGRANVCRAGTAGVKSAMGLTTIAMVKSTTVSFVLTLAA